MIKANAYGHGDGPVSKALRQVGAEYLGVGLIEEGIRLRLFGDQGALLLFGPFDREGAKAVLEYDLTPVVSQWSQLEALQEQAHLRNQKVVRIHLKFNTGMNRLGFDTCEAPKLRDWLNQNSGFVLDGVCTHLLRGDDAGRKGGESESQLEQFAKLLVAFKGMNFHVHVLNSSGLATLWKRFSEGQALGNGGVWPLGARPGLAVYGIAPSSDEEISLKLEPALSLKSHLVTLHHLQKGSRLSYNATWRASHESLIGVVPIGYADGYSRTLSNRAHLLCRGHRVPVVGTICMDYLMIDLTAMGLEEKPLEIGEEVVLIGSQNDQFIRAEEIANLMGTIPYEVLTGLSERVPRIYL